MASPKFTASIDPEAESLRVVCTGVQLPEEATGSSGNLCCRFGDVEVPATQEGPDRVSCCAPALDALQRQSSTGGDDGAAAGTATVHLTVLASDRVIAEDQRFNYLAAYGKKASKSAEEGEEATAAAQAAVCEIATGQVVADGGGGKAGGESRADKLRRNFSALKPFVIISLSYLLYTTTDGAIRMIVLLHAYNLGFSAFETAIMFTLYEAAGVVTNFLAGIAGSKWGIKSTLLAGLGLQIVGIGMLFAWQDSWGAPGSRWKGLVYVTFAQVRVGRRTNALARWRRGAGTRRRRRRRIGHMCLLLREGVARHGRFGKKTSRHHHQQH